jgi:glycosyltransferase involved in cell wall biosynthesis
VGNFNWEHYARGRNLLRGLRQNKVKVDFVNKQGFFGLLIIFFRIFNINYDAILVTGKPAAFIVNILKFIHNKPVIFDVFISDYENMVENRKLVKEGSIKAKLMWFMDEYMPKWSDYTFLDTIQHADFYAKKFNIPRKKMEGVLIGTDDLRFKETKVKKNKNEFIVLFFGSFIIGHGINVILKSAKHLENYKNIKVKLIGTGQIYDEMLDLSKSLKNNNVEFVGWVDQIDLPPHIQKADCLLGVFEPNLIKITRSIPTKLFELSPLKKVFITGRTKAVEYYCKHKLNILFTKLGDDEDLANKILMVYKDKKLRKKIENNVYELYLNEFKTEKIGKQVKEIIEKQIKENNKKY